MQLTALSLLEGVFKECSRATTLATAENEKPAGLRQKVGFLEPRAYDRFGSNRLK